jgi:hypothetical protein
LEDLLDEMGEDLLSDERDESATLALLRKLFQTRLTKSQERSEENQRKDKKRKSESTTGK